MFWNKTLTLYNKHEDEQTGVVKWYRHIVKDCFVKNTNSKINIGSIQLQTDDTIVRIPTQPLYKSPYDWFNLPNDEKQKYLTLQGGDLLVFGAVEDDIDEYTPGQRSSDLIARYKPLGSVTVKSINVNDFINGGHYLIRGE